MARDVLTSAVMESMDRALSADERSRLRARRAVPWAGGVVLAGAAVLWGPDALRPTLDASDVRTARVDRGRLEATLAASGRIVPQDEEVVSSPLEARVLRVLRRPGAVVEQGEPLLELDVSAARLELDRLEGRMEQLEDEAREAELELQDDLLDLTTHRDLTALDLEEREQDAAQQERLVNEGLAPGTALRQARVRVRKARLELAQLEAQLGNRERSGRSQLRRFESKLRTLAAERDQARRRLELATTLAPRAGVVTWVVGDEGSTIRAGDVLARIADLRAFRIEGTVADLHAGRVREGQRASVALGDERLRGTIARVLPAIRDGKLHFEVDLDEPSHELLRANLRVDVHVAVTSVDDALRLPRGAFANGSGRQDVFVVEGAVARRRPVELGLAGAERWEVVSGLEEGEEVVVSDVSTIRHLSEVRWRDDR